MMDAVQDAVTRPFPEIVVDGRARRKVLRQLAPLAAGPQHVADRVHGLAHVGFALAPARARRRDHRLDELPFRIRQIARITSCPRLVQLARLFCPHGNLHADSVARQGITGDSSNARTFRTGSEMRKLKMLRALMALAAALFVYSIANPALGACPSNRSGDRKESRT